MRRGTQHAPMVHMRTPRSVPSFGRCPVTALNTERNEKEKWREREREKESEEREKEKESEERERRKEREDERERAREREGERKGSAYTQIVFRFQGNDE